MTVCSFPSLYSHSIQFVLERLPSEDALLEDLLESFIPFEFLLAGVFLIFLSIVMQINLNAGTVHCFPDIVKA